MHDIAEPLGGCPAVADFARRVQAEYGAPAFHDFRHAVDVAEAVATAAMHLGSAEWDPRLGGFRLTREEVAALLLAALLHDVGHPGVTSKFLVESNSPLAAVFDPANGGVLEQYHAAKAAELLQSLRTSNNWELQRRVRSLILATDMAKHGFMVERIGELVDTRFKPETSSAFQHCSIDALTSEERMLVLQFTLKMCDIGNVAKPRAQAWRWAHRLHDEFKSQIKMEQHLEPPICTGLLTPDTSVSKMVSGFLSFVAPAFEQFERLLPSLGAGWRQQMAHNQSHWAALATAEELKMAQNEVYRSIRRHSSPSHLCRA
jgi:hypothetical protein